MRFLRITQAKWFAVVGTVLFFAFAFVLAMAIYGLNSLPWSNFHAIFNLGLLFAVLGAFYGTIVALDRESGMSHADRPLLRTVLCCALGSAAVLLVQAWPPQTFNSLGPITGALIGGMLGWIGWTWAKYVDF